MTPRGRFYARVPYGLEWHRKSAAQDAEALCGRRPEKWLPRVLEYRPTREKDLPVCNYCDAAAAAPPLPDSVDLGGKWLGYRYYFVAAPLLPVLVVAVEGDVADWAAYAAGVPIYGDVSRDDWLELVHSTGAKLAEAEARGFFPSIELRYRQ